VGTRGGLLNYASVTVGAYSESHFDVSFGQVRSKCEHLDVSKLYQCEQNLLFDTLCWMIELHEICLRHIFGTDPCSPFAFCVILNAWSDVDDVGGFFDEKKKDEEEKVDTKTQKEECAQFSSFIGKLRHGQNIEHFLL